MADARADGEAAADSDGGSGGTHEPRECMACRGTGQVISNLGGSASRVACPWCGGGGVRRADIDAQAVWADSAPLGAGAPSDASVAGEKAPGSAPVEGRDPSGSSSA